MTKQEKIEALRKRVELFKDTLLAIPGWRVKLIQKWPDDYDSMKGANFVNNVLRGASTDEELTLRLEQIIEEHKISEDAKTVKV